MTIKLFPDRHIPRLIIFVADVVVCCISVYVAYLIRFNFQIPAIEVQSFRFVFPIIIGTRILTFYFFKTYTGIIRYTSTRDATRILIVLAAGSAFFALLNPVVYFFTEKFAVPFSIIIID